MAYNRKPGDRKELKASRTLVSKACFPPEHTVRLQSQLKKEAEMWRDLDTFGAISIEKLKILTILSLTTEVNLEHTDSCTAQSGVKLCGALEKGGSSRMQKRVDCFGSELVGETRDAQAFT